MSFSGFNFTCDEVFFPIRHLILTLTLIFTLTLTLTLTYTISKSPFLVSLFFLRTRIPLQAQNWCNRTSERPTRCRTEVVMAVAVVVEEVVDTQMGMMTIRATMPVESQEVETILQPIPTGMLIQGLDVAV